MLEQNKYKNIILGAGPAGLAAGYELAKNGQPVLILEKENKVGGMCRTETYQGNRFDLAPHRFFTKNSEVKNLWQTMLGPDFLEIPRLTRIYYKRKFFYYPLKPVNALKNLGLKESLKVLLSFFAVRFKRILKTQPLDSFESWVINRFGKRLFYHFFKSYTEKLWGIKTDELSAEWAAQRIKTLSLSKAVKGAFLRPRHGKVKSLIEKFHYPRLGSGMFYEKMANDIKQNGGGVLTNCEVVTLNFEGRQIKGVEIANKGEKREFLADNFISTLPLNKLIALVKPWPAPGTLAAAKNLKFRSIVFLALLIKDRELFQDNWLYMQEPEVKMTRITNFKNWSGDLISQPRQTILGLEYVCWEGDELWQMADEDLIGLAKKELELVGLVSPHEIKGGQVIRLGDAYPIYAFDYENNLKVVLNYLHDFRNLQTIGRSGMFRYNNMDHSILTGFYAARNILGQHYDIFEINSEGEYFEEQRS